MAVSGVGTGRVWVFVSLAAIAIGYGINASTKRKREEFQGLVLETLRRRMGPEEMRTINQSLTNGDFRKVQLIRHLEIIKESMDISLSSKKRDVAESRYELMCDHFTEVQKSYTDLLDAYTMMLVRDIVSKAGHEFHTALFKNMAQGNIEKAAKLKTTKARQKYWMAAREIIEEGMGNPNSDKGELQSLLSQIPSV